ncbi:MAG: 30S ribosomal protein S17 [Candidatus Korarchaeum sp.]|nr:30S ribosomal protein S17 [Candidatus Korarchaeum sp.]MDW8036370.1 30S ribosomal protein S17 [Candidatus Korarchaeum sp.]
MRKIPEELMRGLIPPESSCDDDKCPWHGNISLRNASLEGRVVSAKMTRTVSVLIEYLNYNKKYKRYERRRSKIHAHLPPCLEVSEGDFVRIVETRRLAKTVSHVVLGKLK